MLNLADSIIVKFLADTRILNKQKSRYIVRGIILFELSFLYYIFEFIFLFISVFILCFELQWVLEIAISFYCFQAWV